MTSIVTRSSKGTPLTYAEMDANLTNLNTDKLEATTTVSLTNKTINLSNNTITGTTAQFNTALSDNDFATLAGIETLTNKSVNLANNTLTGTKAQFNIAVSDGDFLFSGDALGTPSSGTLTNCTFPTLNQNTSGTAAGLSSTLGVSSGGTGLTTVGTVGNVLTSNGSVWVSQAPSARGITLASAVNTTSGTAIDFTGIPSWVKRITVMFNGVSTNGTSRAQVQLGAGSIQTSGYLSIAGDIGVTVNTSGASAVITTGLVLDGYVPTATRLRAGCITLTAVYANTWVASTALGDLSGVFSSTSGGGSVTLSGTLDRLRLTTVNGTDAFDAGSVNIMYEG